MKAKNQENLKALIKLMKELPVDQLKMEHWECGTAACVGGWVARMPEFKAMGGKSSATGVPVIPSSDYAGLGWGAVAAFLGIEPSEAKNLCCCDYNYELEDDIWMARQHILFSEVKPSDVVEVLEQWLE